MIEIMPKLDIAAAYAYNKILLDRYEDKLIMKHNFCAENSREGDSRMLRSPTCTAESMYKFESSYFLKEVLPIDFIDTPFTPANGGMFNLGVLENYYIFGCIAKIKKCHIFNLERIRSNSEQFKEMLNTMGFNRDPARVEDIVEEQILIDKKNGVPRSGVCRYPEFENRSTLLSEIFHEDFGYPQATDVSSPLKPRTDTEKESRLDKSELDRAIPALLNYYTSKSLFIWDKDVFQKITLCFMRLFEHAHQLPSVELMLAWSLAYLCKEHHKKAYEIFDYHFENSTGLRKYFIAMLRATFDKNFLFIAQRLHNKYYLPNLSDIGKSRLNCDLLVRQQQLDKLCQIKGYSLL